MKNSLYSRVRRYTYLVILTLMVSFAVAMGAFLYYELQIESQLERNAHFHGRSAQLATGIQEQLLPLRVLLDAHHAGSADHGEAAHSDTEEVRSLTPTALYNVGVALKNIVNLQQSYDGDEFGPTIDKIERELVLLRRSSTALVSSDQSADADKFAAAVRALILSANQLERLHLVAGERLDRLIEVNIDERSTILLPLALGILALSVAVLAYLMSQIRVAFVREEEAARSLVESEKNYRTLVQTVPYGVVEVDLAGTIVFANKAYARILGVEERDLAGQKLWAHLPDEEARQGLKDHLQTMVEQKLAISQLSGKFVCKDGAEIDVEFVWGCKCDSAGSPARLIAVVSDVTARLQLEETLRQSQKMEAIGQLTGGIAHEFNNLLGIVHGNAELLTGKEGSDAALAEPILRAAARGSKLTEHLLSFARKQPLSPQAIDLGALVASMSQMLPRTLGASIETDISAPPSLWNASADPAQLETALLNLAINARDAMPRGGKLTISCDNVHLDEDEVAENPEVDAGDYVLIAVSDNGTGMSDKVRSHAFEPFYTTKEVGKGTGLGLSMVYGFAEQSGGHVSIDSKEGQGTTVRLYLPRHESAAPAADRDETTEMPRGRGEAVLVIEDDREMRDLAVNMLNALGYRVTDVPEAASARAALERGEVFDLVLSDIVLPGGMNGREFAEEMSARNPDFKVIFMSGYPAEAARHNGIDGSDRVLLRKPFRRRDLAEALRAALD